MQPELLLLSFVLAWLSVYAWIRFNKKWFGIDINKLNQRKIPEGTGIVLLVPLWVTAAIGIWMQWIAWNEALPWLALISLFSIIGFLDDTKNKFLSQKEIGWMARAIPIALVSLAFSWLFAPQWVWVVPIALLIAGLASFQNTFAGLNGWQSGSGIIIGIAVLFLVQAHPASFWLDLMLLGAIAGFWYWNHYPARCFEGDAGTLLIGSGIAGVLVMTGDLRTMLAGFLLFLPHVVDLVFKYSTHPDDTTQRKKKPYRLMDNGNLAVQLNDVGKPQYDFAGLLLWKLGPMKEWKVVGLLWLVVALNALVWLKFFGAI